MGSKRRRITRRGRARSFIRRRAASKKKIPLAPVIGLVGTVLGAKHPFAADGDTMVSKLMAGDMSGAAKDFAPAFTGMADGKMHWGTLLATWAPLFVGVGIHTAASKLGVNRALSGVPFVNV